ncbi:hypothetical protein LCGC14_2814070, partial [marine sediment metagenome]
MSKVIEILLADGTEFKGELADCLRRLVDQVSPLATIETRNQFVGLLFEVFQQADWTPPGEDTSAMMRHEFLADFREGEHLFDVTFKFNESQVDGRSPRERGIIARADSAHFVAGRLANCLCMVDVVMVLGLTGETTRKSGVEYDEETLVLHPKTIGIMKQYLIGFE